jgi:hypothetical protein
MFAVEPESDESKITQSDFTNAGRMRFVPQCKPALPRKRAEISLRPSRYDSIEISSYCLRCGEAFSSRAISLCAESGACSRDSVMMSSAETV